MQAAPFVLNQDNPRRRAAAQTQRQQRAKITRFQATIGKLQTTFRADPTARQISAIEPSVGDRVNAMVDAGIEFLDGLGSSRVNCPTPHCICGPAPRNSARYRGSEAIVRRQRSFGDNPR